MCPFSLFLVFPSFSRQIKWTDRSAWVHANKTQQRTLYCICIERIKTCHRNRDREGATVFFPKEKVREHALLLFVCICVCHATDMSPKGLFFFLFTDQTNTNTHKIPWHMDAPFFFFFASIFYICARGRKKINKCLTNISRQTASLSLSPQSICNFGRQITCR